MAIAKEFGKEPAEWDEDGKPDVRVNAWSDDRGTETCLCKLSRNVERRTIDRLEEVRDQRCLSAPGFAWGEILESRRKVQRGEGLPIVGDGGRRQWAKSRRTLTQLGDERRRQRKAFQMFPDQAVEVPRGDGRRRIVGEMMIEGWVCWERMLAVLRGEGGPSRCTRPIHCSSLRGWSCQ